MRESERVCVSSRLHFIFDDTHSPFSSLHPGLNQHRLLTNVFEL